ncbi:MAG: hypothetical protein H0X50_10310 [Nitrosopumilus sp.]|nr:hypothetical protein [Nitrosopumilus sp.]
MSSSDSKQHSTSTSSSLSLIKKGRFYFIFEESKSWVLEDKTKRGLEVKEKTFDSDKGVLSEKGMIYDMNGRGIKVNIRWHYPKDKHSIEEVEKNAQTMERRYIELREITCPSD